MQNRTVLFSCPFCPHEDGTGTITAGSAYPVHNRTQTENCVTKPRFYPQKGVSTMKREDVKNKITGITEEQPNWLMQENGSDITREKFLSTLSLRRATTCYCSGSLICNFYPRSPCGERPLDGLRKRELHRHFYPRSPCGERPILKLQCVLGDFYPRSPCGERPVKMRRSENRR